MIVAQQCGTNVLHKAYRSPKARAVTGCGQVVEYGSWGVYELKGKEGQEFCRECFPEGVS